MPSGCNLSKVTKKRVQSPQNDANVKMRAPVFGTLIFYFIYLHLLHRLNHRDDVGRVDRAVTVDVGGDVPGFNGYGFGRVSGFIDNGAVFHPAGGGADDGGIGEFDVLQAVNGFRRTRNGHIGIGYYQIVLFIPASGDASGNAQQGAMVMPSASPPSKKDVTNNPELPAPVKVVFPLSVIAWTRSIFLT